MFLTQFDWLEEIAPKNFMSINLRITVKAYHQLSANDIFFMSSIERKTYSSIERRFKC